MPHPALNAVKFDETGSLRCANGRFSGSLAAHIDKLKVVTQTGQAIFKTSKQQVARIKLQLRGDSAGQGGKPVSQALRRPLVIAGWRGCWSTGARKLAALGLNQPENAGM